MLDCVRALIETCLCGCSARQITDGLTALGGAEVRDNGD